MLRGIGISTGQYGLAVDRNGTVGSPCAGVSASILALRAASNWSRASVSGRACFSTHMGAHGRLCVRMRIAGGRAASALLWSRNPLVSGGPETHRT